LNTFISFCKNAIDITIERDPHNTDLHLMSDDVLPITLEHSILYGGRKYRNPIAKSRSKTNKHVRNPKQSHNLTRNAIHNMTKKKET